MDRKQGFTLVELLVVIAIIALLISILAPSLGSVKKLAKDTICKTNLRAIAQGATVYAVTNKGALPTWGRDYSCQSPNYGAGCAFHVSITADGASSSPCMPLGCAKFLEAGTVGNPQVYYCPGTPAEELDWLTWARNSVNVPWGTKGASGWFQRPDGTDAEMLYLGYMFNPHTELTGKTMLKYKLLDKLPTDRPLVLDWFGNPLYTGHPINGPCSWNLAFADCHVETKANKKLYELIKTNPVGGWDPGYSTLVFEVYMKALMAN